jgi:hypothetical protein
MHEIICPHCSKAFKVDEAGYADILKQVRDADFDKQLHARLELAEQAQRNAIELARTQAASELQKATASKEAEIQELRAQLNAGEMQRQLAVQEALSALEKDRDALANALEQEKREKQAARDLAEARLQHETQRAAAEKEAEIQTLKAKLESISVAQELAITRAVGDVEKERDELRNGLARAELEKKLAEQALKDQVRNADQGPRRCEIERLRDMKARLSTKMIGETLEQHCETEFNRIRATAFPRAYFEKDNDARTGSKGDYILRDFWMKPAPRSSPSCSK